MFNRLINLTKKIMYKDLEVRSYVVTRLAPSQIEEMVFFCSGDKQIDVSQRHCMICLDPFSVAIWLSAEQFSDSQSDKPYLLFKKNGRKKAILHLSLIESTAEENDTLLLYKAERPATFQLNPLIRFITLSFFLRNRSSSLQERKLIAALYSYPRKIIAVSYKEEGYCNIFPMDIEGHIPGSNLYILGLRNSNFTLKKILEQKKLLVADTSDADIGTIYSLGRHQSISPPPIGSLPFSTSNSELFKFPVPGFSSSYKELEIIRSRNMGYHMLLVGRILNEVNTVAEPASLCHLHLFEFVHSGYEKISNAGYN